MTPYTDEWNKWRAGRRSKMLIERSKRTITLRNLEQKHRDRCVEKCAHLFVPRQGDNFRFVRWGGLGDLSLWSKR